MDDPRSYLDPDGTVRVIAEVAPAGTRMNDAACDLQRRYWGGTLRQELRIPAEQTTCCAFDGEGMHRFYVTTATENSTDAQRRAQPGAGLVYRLDTDTTGQPAAPFRPDPRWWRETEDLLEVDGWTENR